MSLSSHQVCSCHCIAVLWNVVYLSYIYVGAKGRFSDRIQKSLPVQCLRAESSVDLVRLVWEKGVCFCSSLGFETTPFVAAAVSRMGVPLPTTVSGQMMGVLSRPSDGDVIKWRSRKKGLK